MKPMECPCGNPNCSAPSGRSVFKRSENMKILFKNGTVFDGSGGKPFAGDVLIENDRILKVGECSTEADEIVDATGLYVCPGFIDAHSHNDFFCDRDDSERFFRPFVEQGIATQITGNCSFSPFGTAEKTPYRDKLGGGLFESRFSGSLKAFSTKLNGKLHVNIVPLVGHGAVRAGIRGYDPTPLTPEQLKTEISFVRQAMEDGAFGGSMGFMYEPNMYATKDELYAFAREIAKYDGILTVHARACSAVSADYPLITKKSHLELALDEIVDIMEKTGCRTEYSHLIFTGKRSWSKLDKMLGRFHELKAQGKPIAYDNYAFHYGASVITIVFPEWYAKLTKEQSSSPLNRFKLFMTILMYRKVLGIDWEDMTVAYISDDHPEYEGKTVLQLAKEEGVKPLDMYLKLVEISERRGRIYLGKYYNDKIVRTLMEDDMSVFMTDAWVEEKGLQNIAAFQTFPQFFLLAKRWGIAPETVVRKMTGATADRYGIKERGYLKEGFKADISIIDPAKLSVNEAKPDAKPGGIHSVYINGKAALKNFEYIGGSNGEFILKK